MLSLYVGVGWWYLCGAVVLGGKSLNPIDMTLIDGFSIKADTATIIEK